MLDLNSINAREDFKIALIEKALKDPGFWNSLVQDPQTVLVQELGPEQAQAISIEVHQEKKDKIFFCINYNPNSPLNVASIKINANDSVEEKVVKKAWKDLNYRRELLSNPASKVIEETGLDILPSVEFKVLEESRNQLHLILPEEAATMSAETQDDTELSEEELESVAGGGAWMNFKQAVKRVTSIGDACIVTKAGCSSSSGVRG